MSLLLGALVLGAAGLGHKLVVPRPAPRPSEPPTAPFEPGKIGLPREDYAGALAYQREPTVYSEAAEGQTPAFWAEQCPKLKQQFSWHPNISKLTCKETKAELAALGINDVATVFSVGLTKVFKIDVGGAVVGTVKKIGGWLS